jgi:hypothetical protein
MKTVLAGLLALVISAAAFGQTKTTPKRMGGAIVPPYGSMKAAVEKRWKERYPAETILSIDAQGEPEYVDEPGKSETMSSTSGGFDDYDWTWHETSWSTTIQGRQGSFCRQQMVVTVERANKTKARFSVAALYKLSAGQWQFVEMPVGKVEEMAGAGSAGAPSKADAAKIFAEAWKAARPDFKVEGVDVLGSEFHQSKGRQWYTYKLAVNVTGAKNAKKFKCTPADYSSVLNWDKDKSQWAADQKAIADINESGQCEER